VATPRAAPKPVPVPVAPQRVNFPSPEDLGIRLPEQAEVPPPEKLGIELK